ncbi:50S ribosomal protein L10 [Spiroplasma endosymbiont of Asaphidion curtum]|uniref:50S ribosomal protein L10 n=1 Tax=Spiroplasma endosymbiont of Asaphidion curtum TaxID=3066281 RepID=UPI00313F1568
MFKKLGRDGWMRPAKEIKSNIVQEIKTKIASSKSTTIIHYHGFSVQDLTNLKLQLRSENASLKIYKNTLVRRALQELKITNLDDILLGPNALVFSATDEIVGPRLLTKFAKEHKNLVLKSAIFDGEVVLYDELQVLATLPSKEDLISMFASAIISPLINVALAIKAIIDKK